MDAHLRAGVAIYDAGHHHAAHDAWEDRWLELEQGTDDERLLHGLIQCTAAVHHGHERNWEGVRGLAESAGGYLDELPAEYRGVELDPVRAYLARLAADPEHVERAAPPALTYEGRTLDPEDLDFEATAVAALALAEAEEYDEETVARGVEYAREDVASEETGSRFVPLVFDFVRDPENRGIVVQRLGQHVDRRRARDEDVKGLFD